TEAEAAAEEVAEEAEAAVEEAAEEEAPAVSPVFKKLLEVPWYTWVVIAALVVAAILLALSTKNAKWNSRQISMGAMCIAIAFVLSCIRLFRMPQGGSITPAAMLPLILFMVACGPLKGFVVGCAYGLLQLITDPYVIHPIQLLVDYPLAYGAMILGCLAMPRQKEGSKLLKLTDDKGTTTGYVESMPTRMSIRLPIAVLLAGIGRYIMAVLSGAIFFSEYAGEQNAWVYSLVYNISYLGPDTLVCMLIACIPGMPRLVEMIRKKG
ncbi:MAG: energy-coupled thiamine transporter ThiT, partial [Clostridia bacterium]|nr:energy-coupled thiamine transporter ThiT [Clostridia bacterium]